MAQQTQIARVNERYPRFLRAFPTLRRLAESSPGTILRHWRGMGYNNRAIRLQQLAREVVTNHRGRMPRTVEGLEHLPGIGPYTARAIACFAFGKHVPVVDTNVRRVLMRLDPRLDVTAVWDLAARLLPQRRSYEWNQGLMELGATVCTARTPRCAQCPLRRACPSVDKTPDRAALTRRPERLYRGLPNRIYRGRIIDVLRAAPQRSGLPEQKIGVAILAGFTGRHSAWLRRVLTGLERDKLVRIRRQGRVWRAALVA